MSVAYVQLKKYTLDSAQLGREVFIDEISDLTDDQIARLIAEANATIASIRDEQRDYPQDHHTTPGRRHRMMIWRAYRTQCNIEAELRRNKL